MDPHRFVPPLACALLALVTAACSGFRAPEPQQRGQVTLHLAEVALAAGAPDVALRVAELVLQRQPGNASALATEGDALYAMGQLLLAQNAYRAAVAADPQLVTAQLGLGRTLVRADPPAAEKAFEAVLALEPTNAAALNNLGIARDLQGRHADAQAAYQQALAATPDAKDVRVNLGLSLALSGQADQAVSLLQPLAAEPGADKAPKAALTVALSRTTGAKATPMPAAQMPAAAMASAVPPLAAVGEVTRALDIKTAPRTAVMRQDLPPPAPPVIAMVTSVSEGAAKAAVAAERFQVQLASLDTERAAQAEWQRLQGGLPALLDGHSPAVVPATVHDRTYWRLRAGGFASFTEAMAFCAKLRDAGSSCWPLAPNPPP